MPHRAFASVCLSFLLLTAVESAAQNSSLVHPAARPLIVGGERLTSKDPRSYWVAELVGQTHGDQPKSAICTATHISDDVLLTAAHCFHEKNMKFTINYTTTSWFFGTSRAVQKIKIHEGYPQNAESDLALVKISENRPSEQKVLALDLSPPTSPTFAILSIGYGITNSQLTVTEGQPFSGDGLETLRVTTDNVVDFDVTRSSFLIDMSTGHGINSGDSGGPAIVLQNGIPQILGVARSVSFDTVGNTRIFDEFGTYTSVPFYQDWIQKELKILEAD